jgi:hypothetical protein
MIDDNLRERSMDASALANAESWLSIISTAKLVAAFLVAIGVVIEFGGDWVARPFEKTVEAARSAEMARLSTEAASARAAIAEANMSASEAIAEAAKLGVSFGNLNDFVNAQKADNDKTLAELRKDATDLNKARSDALAAAEGTKKTLAEMSSLLDQQRTLQQRMIEAMAPRSITEKQAQSIIAEISRYHDIKVAIYLLGETPEISTTGRLISRLLDSASWKQNVWSWTGGGSATGILVSVKNGSGAHLRTAASSLVNVLVTAGIAASLYDWTGDWDHFGGMLNGPEKPTEAPLRIVVGTKPLPQ